ncbi:MAG: NAD-glutamate dehydrogenase [Mariprofundaceae bacterium]|nr:NAD-glutamate dehydrogenase [Mariprofundaceae bacterium]
MRKVRQSLMLLLHEAAKQYQVHEIPKRLQAAVLHDAMTLLPLPECAASSELVALHLRTLRTGSLHRHVLIIRCPDQAFYLDAVKSYLTRHGIEPIQHQTVVAAIYCNKKAQCRIELGSPEASSDENFMFIAIHLSAALVKNSDVIKQDIHVILRAVALSVVDFPKMRKKLRHIGQKLGVDNAIEGALLDWMNDDHYVIYGMQLGSWRQGVMRHYPVLDRIIPGLRKELPTTKAASSVGLEWLSLASMLNHLYSPSRMEVVRISWLEHDSLQQGILIGHFARSGRYTNASEIPRLQQTWRSLCQSKMLKYSSFYRREIRSLFDRMPKPVLLGVPGQDWLKPLKEITDLSSPTQMSVARLTPEYSTIEFLMMAMMGDRFGPNILSSIRDVLQHEGLIYHDHISINMGSKKIIIAAIGASVDGVKKEWPAMASLHTKLQNCIVFWKDQAKQSILSQPDKVNIPKALYALEALPRLYQELYPPEQFVHDLQAANRIAHQQRRLVRIDLQKKYITLHIYSHNNIPLGVLIERIQAFGLLAVQESLLAFGHGDQQIDLITLRCTAPSGLRVEAKERLSFGIETVLNEEADHDLLNALLISGGLSIRDIAVLITLRNHLIQLLPDAAPGPLSSMMNQYPMVSSRLYRVFEALHRPGMPQASSPQSCLSFKKSMRDVASLTHDRWFRALESIVLSSLRSNAYKREIAEPLAIKLDPKSLDFIAHPKPYREIFVHGIHVEGVHLRAGSVARGGIRYSDRANDFRTEVLELMATQTVKNGQILPTGAKGGFVIRGDAVDAEFVLKQYRLFIRALLKLTDNLVVGDIVPPVDIRIAAMDQNDPYLVVAADKGTASFSDDANHEAEDYQYWLGDAFASGGRYGYDHKVFGITARGAWVCAEQHFHTLGRDAAMDSISVVGIGDMAGDVFGNGMLLNPNIRLIAAFNHRHIFLDPNPKTPLAFAERQRLFQAAQGWNAYQSNCISHGGGVFERSSKKIILVDETCAALGITTAAISGEALIRAILKAPVDLLYNGGIGTYVKGSHELHTDVRDPANNSVRVNASDLRCAVVCEGGNLGFTQHARIEYAQEGGLIYTDAIDNAAGVNMSDHEVNLKILFSATDAGDIGTKRRNQVLAGVADAITEQCLDDNRQQANAIMLAQIDAQNHLPRLMRLREQLVDDARLDLRIDAGMHDDKTLALTPQLAVLLGHEKNRIHDALNADYYAEWSLFTRGLLLHYFPLSIRRRFQDQIIQHPLRISLANTCVSNHVLNNNGLTSVHYLQSLLDTSAAYACEALMIAEQLLSSQLMRDRIQQSHGDAQLLNKIQHSIQEYHLQFAEELLRLCDVRKLDAGWLKRQQQSLRTFKKTEAVMGIEGNKNNYFSQLLRDAVRTGLPQESVSSLAKLPELAQIAPALYLSRQYKRPLKHCLHAMQAVLHLLPFSAVESPMRAANWGEDEVHLLRCEWFHRLTQLKAKAGAELLMEKHGDYLQRGKERWAKHRHWPSLQAFLLESTKGSNNPNSNETQRTHLMLMMARLESVVEESQVSA